MKTPTTKRTTRRIAASIAIAAAVATSATLPTQAARYWTGNTSTAWDDTSNWSGNGSGHFYIQPVAESKMLTTIDNDECSGYQTHLYCGTEEKPFVFSNSGTFTAGTQFDIGYWGNASGAVLFQGGKFSIGTLYIGNEATSEKDASEGYLKLDSTALTVTASANLNNGKLVADNSTFTCKDMNAGHGTNCVVTIEKNSGDWTFSGTPNFGTGTGSVVRVYHRGGSMNSGQMFVGVSGVPADVYFEISGGVVTNTTYATIGDAVVTVKDGGKLVGARDDNKYGIVVGSGSSDATINIKDGGEVYVPTAGVDLCNDGTSTATINISNGGALTARNIWVRYNNAGNAATINLDGGIIRATADIVDFINANSRLHIYVGANGGTFDTAGHAVTIGEDLENKSGATGFVRFAGGGTATLSGAVSYTGVTYVDAGTKLVATTAAEKTNILKNGLEMIGTPTLGTAYTIFTSSEELTEDDLANVKCRMASNPTIALSEDNLSIVVTVDALAPACWTGAAGDCNLSNAANWSDGVVPTAGSVATILCTSPTTLTAGGTFAPDTIVIPESSSVVTLSGSLTLNTLTNAYKLAIASGASLTITGDLVGYAANNTRPLLYSNYGTVTVNGIVRFRSSGTTKGESIVSQYNVADENTEPIIANGLAYHQDSGSDYLVANLGSMNNGVGKWVVGATGFTYPKSRDIWHSGFRVDGQDVTLYSSDDWTLAESPKHKGNDLYIIDTGTVTIDSTDYNDKTTGRTVTLKGYINAQGTAATPLTITGCGTVVLDSATANNHTNVVNGAIAVENGATLQINKDVVVGGTGSISLAAGATLAIPANDDRTISVRDIVPLVLPETGTATLRIDGNARLPSGEYTLLDSVPENYAKLEVDPTTAAIAGRRASVVKKNGQLVLNIQPDGLMIIFR